MTSKPSQPGFRGRFLDTRTLGFALTNEAGGLDDMCKAFGLEGKLSDPRHGVITPEYINYNRRDVSATAELLFAELEEFGRHPIQLDPCQALSPATIAKAYLNRMGIVSPAVKFQDIPAALLGIAMTAYFGGRVETRIRKTIMPVVHTDFLSTYPTVNALLGLWRFLIAAKLEIVEDATSEVRELLGSVTPAGVFNPAFWQGLTFFAELEPAGDFLPVRAQYDGLSGAPNIGINPLWSRTPLWYAGPDLVASILLSGRVPKILRAIRLVPHGIQRGLRRVRLRGAIDVDPRVTDFFRTVVEARQRVRRTDEKLSSFLKVLANAGSYGIFMEFNRQALRAGEHADITIYGLQDTFVGRTTGPEDPGAFCFPPLAALIPAAARLLLALLERCVTDMEGTYAMCDTDSLAIVAAESASTVPCKGGPLWHRDRSPAVQALSWGEVDAIVKRFASLNTYDRTVVPGSILKVEDQNFRTDPSGELTSVRQQLHCFSVSAKRYVLFNLDTDKQVTIRKPSEHGLGHLLNPVAKDERTLTDRHWITEVWEYLIGTELRQRPALPFWATRPAISRLNISSPLLWRPFAAVRRALPYQQRVKPMNFLLSAHVAKNGHPPGVDASRFHLIAGFESDPRAWPRATWINIRASKEEPKEFGITTTAAPTSRIARIKSYREVIADYAVHPESKSLGPDGKPCGPRTVGLLQRRPLRIDEPPIYIGKESNLYEEVEQDLVHELEEALEIYVDPRTDPWRTDVVPLLKLIPSLVLADESGLSQRTIKAIRNEHSAGTPEHQAALLQIALRHARRLVKAKRTSPPVREAVVRLLASPLARTTTRDAKSRRAGPQQRRSGRKV